MKRLVSTLLILTIFLGLAPINTFAAGESGYIRNNYIEAYIGSGGHYTMGTTGGNPDTDSDDYALLLYGHPDSTTTETLIRIDGEDHYFYADQNTFSADGKKCVSTMTIGDVLIAQTISLQYNTYTQRADVMEIRYDLKNNSDSSKELGGRIMLDTMLGHNNGAPFRIPGIGDVTKECEFVGEHIPQYWQSFDDLTDPSVVSSGTFYKDISQRPDKVQFAAWPYITGSSWNYTIDTNEYVTSDSAVAAYYNPKTVASGTTRSFCTYYGLSNLSEVETVGEISFRLTGDISELTPNGEGTAYTDNPFTLTAYVLHDSPNAKDVTVTLNVPSELAVNTATTQTLSLQPDVEGNISWEIWAKPQATQKTVNYSITVSADGQEKSVTKSILLPAVSYYNVNELTLNKTHITTQKGKNEQLIAYLNTADGLREAEKYEVRWYSSDTSIARVDASGNIKALKAGTTVIRAITADYKLYKTCTVTVQPRPTTELDLWGLSDLVYKNLTPHVGKNLTEVFPLNNDGTTGGIYDPSEKFHNETITKNQYYREELGDFKIHRTKRFDESDFYAASFIDAEGDIVIAYRGSNTLFGRDGIEDLAFAVYDSLGPQFYQAWYFYNQVKEAFPSKKIILTGHSLGGALATFVSIMEDVEAITFNGAQGLIIDLTYYVNAYYVDQFKGIDKWKFKNHYNEKDLVGSRNPDIFDSFAHVDNGKGTYSWPFAPHHLNTFVNMNTAGKLALSSAWRKADYYLNKSNWTRVLAAQMPSFPAYDLMGLDFSKIKLGAGRVLLGTAGNTMKTLSAPGNWVEICDNVFFSAGNTKMTGNGSAPDTFVFKNFDTMYGKGDNDTYITYESGNFHAEINDPSGNDKIIFKNMAMSELSLGDDDGERYRINTGGGHQVWVDKHRNWLQPEIVIVDKYGEEKKISQLGTSAAAYSLRSFVPSEASKITTLFLEGQNITFDILDAEKNILGTYNSGNTDVVTNEYAYIYTTTADGLETVEIELLDPNLFVRINDGENLKLSALYGAVDAPDGEIFKADLDLDTNDAALIDGNAESADRFVYINDDDEISITTTQLAKVSAIIPMASGISTFSMRNAVIDNIEIYAGEKVDIDLSFEPLNIAIDDVSLELLENNDVATVSIEDNKVTVRGKAAGTDTLKITALDGSGTSISIPITVQQDTIDDAELTANGITYTENTWSDHPVKIQATAPAGYDTLIYEVDGLPQENQNDGYVTITAEGESFVKVYAKNSESGKVTEAKTYTVKVDLSAPILEEIQDGDVYYIDKLIKATDINLDTVTINSNALDANEKSNGKWINTPGEYTIVATDHSGKSIEATVELKALPHADELTLNDATLVSDIRNAFEDIKYELDPDRMLLLDSAIYDLENKISFLQNPENGANSILAFSIEGQIGNATINDAISTIQIEVTPAALASARPATIALSNGATIFPLPQEVRDFSNPVTYTVTAANGSTREWIVYASLPNDATAPKIIAGSCTNNILTLEFDDQLSQITDNGGFTVKDKSGNLIDNAILNVSCFENIVNIEFESSFDEMMMAKYTVFIAPDSLLNISNLGNSAESFDVIFGGIHPSHEYANDCDINCDLCGSTRPVTGHIYTDNCDPDCNICGDIRSVDPHSYSNDCDPDCNICGDIRTVDPHSYFNDCDPDCNICGSIRQISHFYENACDTYCDVCGTTREITHSYTNACDAICNICRFTRNVNPHAFTNSCDTICDICGAIRGITHTFANACDTSCNICGVTRQIVHAFGEYVYNNDATSTSDGTKTRTCSVCKASETILAEGTKLANPFSDVKPDKFYTEPVLWAVDKGITNGLTETTFGPGKTCTRGQIVTFLWRAAGSPEPMSTTNPFTDVKEDKFYYKAVLWAVENDITNGTSATTFSPNNPCTRGQVVTFLWRAKGSDKVTAENSFADVTKGFYVDAVAWASKNDITQGTTETTFAPTKPCTRGQIVTFLFRAYK